MKYEKKVIIIMNILKTTKLNNESFLFKTLSSSKSVQNES